LVNKLRVQRIGDRIREELSEMLVRDLSDPRLAGASITDVKVDRELAYADIFVSAVEGSSRAQEIVGGLEHASGYIRRELSQRVELRVFPRLRFHWDPTPERAESIDRLIHSLHNGAGSSNTVGSAGADEQEGG
jgi:ribosome-binding factor A